MDRPLDNYFSGSQARLPLGLAVPTSASACASPPCWTATSRHVVATVAIWRTFWPFFIFSVWGDGEREESTAKKGGGGYLETKKVGGGSEEVKRGGAHDFGRVHAGRGGG